MQIFYVTSDSRGQTKIAFQEGLGAPQILVLDGPELKCLYEFHLLMVARCNGHTINFSCKKTNATNVWEEHWIAAYRADGFRNKPAKHAHLIKALDEAKTRKGIEFRFKRISLKKQNELVALINPKAVRRPIPNVRQNLPGDDLLQRHESVRSLVDRAIQRDRT